MEVGVGVGVGVVVLLDPPPHPNHPSISSNARPHQRQFLLLRIVAAPTDSSRMPGSMKPSISHDDPRTGRISFASLAVVVIVMVTFVDDGRLATDVNVQVASDGRPAQVKVTGVEIAAFADTASVTVPDWPPTIVTGVDGADTVSAV